MTKPIPLSILLLLIAAMPFALRLTASPWWVYYFVGLLIGFAISTRLVKDRLLKLRDHLTHYLVTSTLLSAAIFYFLEAKEPAVMMIAGFFAHYISAAPALTDRTILGRALQPKDDRP